VITSSSPYLGPAAGVAASLLWTMTALCFTSAARRIGAAAVNSARIIFAIAWLGVAHRILYGIWVPHASGGQIVLLSFSGLLGLTLGDLALFKAYVFIGPRLAMLVMTTAPIFTTLLGRLFLGEELTGPMWAGMALTIGGVAWVVLERPASESVPAHSRRAAGLLLALLATLGQAGGSLLSKSGMGHGWLPEQQIMAPLAAAFIRMFFAGLFTIPTIVWLAVRNRSPGAGRRTQLERGEHRTGYIMTFCGSLVGPFLGMWMSLEAFHRSPLGVAQTLCSLTPIFILPFVIVVQKERISARAFLGAVLAVLGTAILFLPRS
jgi:drug/metabolite transporter (DMT)-like permease